MARSLRFVASQLDRLPRSHCRARVILERQGHDLYIGTAEGASAHLNELWCAAEAAAMALQQAVAPTDPEAVQVRGVERFELFGKATVLVAVAARRDHEARPLIGVGQIDGDAGRAAAVAVLNATNRFLEVGLKPCAFLVTRHTK